MQRVDSGIPLPGSFFQHGTGVLVMGESAGDAGLRFVNDRTHARLAWQENEMHDVLLLLFVLCVCVCVCVCVCAWGCHDHTAIKVAQGERHEGYVQLPSFWLL